MKKELNTNRYNFTHLVNVFGANLLSELISKSTIYFIATHNKEVLYNYLVEQNFLEIFLNTKWFNENYEKVFGYRPFAHNIDIPNIISY